MVVVEDNQSGKVVGFLEIGMLPKPTSSEERSLVESALAETAAAAVAASAAELIASAATGEGSPVSDGEREETNDEDEADINRESVGSTAIEKSPDVSFLANVVVDRSQRRRGIGRTMVNSALEIVRELWPEEERIYVSVEQAS